MMTELFQEINENAAKIQSSLLCKKQKTIAQFLSYANKIVPMNLSEETCRLIKRIKEVVGAFPHYHYYFGKVFSNVEGRDYMRFCRNNGI